MIKDITAVVDIKIPMASGNDLEHFLICATQDGDMFTYQGSERYKTVGFCFLCIN